MGLREFIILLSILVIPNFGWADSVPSTGPSYDLKTANTCAAYDLVEMSFLSPIKYPGVLGHLSNIQFASSVSGQYTVQGTIDSSYSINKVMIFASDATGASEALQNAQYNNALCPVSGNSFSCTYSTSDNPKLSDTSKLLIIFYTTNTDVSLVNKDSISKSTTPQAQMVVKLPDRCLDLNVADSSPIISQLSNLKFARTTTNDMDNVYVLQASFDSFYKGTSIGQASELVAVDSATGQVLVPKNISMTGEHRCIPKFTGNVANFNCQYQLKISKITDDSQIRILVTLPNSVTLFNPKLLVAKDLVPPPVINPPTPQPDVVTCGANETPNADNSSCVCNDNFILDTKTNTCVSANISTAPAMAGNNCTLDPNATPDSQPQTILALLLMAVVAARACHYSKN